MVVLFEKRKLSVVAFLHLTGTFLSIGVSRMCPTSHSAMACRDTHASWLCYVKVVQKSAQIV